MHHLRPQGLLSLGTEIKVRREILLLMLCLLKRQMKRQVCNLKVFSQIINTGLIKESEATLKMINQKICLLWHNNNLASIKRVIFLSITKIIQIKWIWKMSIQSRIYNYKLIMVNLIQASQTLLPFQSLDQNHLIAMENWIINKLVRAYMDNKWHNIINIGARKVSKIIWI